MVSRVTPGSGQRVWTPQLAPTPTSTKEPRRGYVLRSMSLQMPPTVYGLGDVVVFGLSGPMRCFWSSNLSQIDTRSSLLVVLVV